MPDDAHLCDHRGRDEGRVTEMKKEQVKELIALAQKVVDRAKKSGAEIAEAIAVDSLDLSAKVRMGAPELIEEAGSHAIGLRVMKNGRWSSTYSSDPTDAGIAAMIADALELASLSEPDEHAMPPDPSELARDSVDLDLFDPRANDIDAKTATKLALAGEQAARDFDPRITNSEGASYDRSVGARALVTSGGFAGGTIGSHTSITVNPVIDDAGGKKRTGYYWDSRRYVQQMADPKSVGEEAARRTLAKLGSRKVETCQAPVIFDPDAGRALLSLFFSCITGDAVYKRASYLIDREGDRAASELVTIVDDPLIPRAPGSRPFDGEGLASRRNVVVDRGKLLTYLCDTYSGRKLGRPSTASASRGLAGRPSTSASNFHLLAGQTDPQEILRGVKRGLYVTSMMGFGFSAVTGDFSRGAEGFWIENGEKTFPVSEITISLNFDELWKSIDAVGTDLDPKTRFATPTFRVANMTVAGT
jgi:PmbA protein